LAQCRFPRARLLPVTIAAFHPSHPGVSVEIVEGSHGELIEQLRDGHLDFLVGALRIPDPGPDVVQMPLFEDDLVVVGRSGHPLCGSESPGAGRLAAFPWVIARAGTPLHGQWREMFLRDDVEPPFAPVTCGSFVTIRRLLIESDFLTLLSPEQIHLEILSGTLVEDWCSARCDAPPDRPDDACQLVSIARAGRLPGRTQIDQPVPGT
jgi:DNA-binding transcriptional LysR family regulator